MLTISSKLILLLMAARQLVPLQDCGNTTRDAPSLRLLSTTLASNAFPKPMLIISFRLSSKNASSPKIGPVPDILVLLQTGTAMKDTPISPCLSALPGLSTNSATRYQKSHNVLPIAGPNLHMTRKSSMQQPASLSLSTKLTLNDSKSFRCFSLLRPRSRLRCSPSSQRNFQQPSQTWRGL